MNALKPVQRHFFASLADARQMLEALDQLPGAMFMIKNLDSRYVFMSRALKEAIHLAADFDVVGKSDFDLFPRIIAESYRQNDLLVFDAVVGAPHHGHWAACKLVGQEVSVGQDQANADLKRVHRRLVVGWLVDWRGLNDRSHGSRGWLSRDGAGRHDRLHRWRHLGRSRGALHGRSFVRRRFHFCRLSGRAGAGACDDVDDVLANVKAT